MGGEGEEALEEALEDADNCGLIARFCFCVGRWASWRFALVGRWGTWAR